MAVIGAGWWGTVGHLRPLAETPEVELVAVCSRTEAKARRRAEELGIPGVYSDYRRMIDECSLDAVSIATTPNVHYEQARYALEHGLHVLMEKPFVLRAEHALELAALAQGRGLLLSVCHPLLFNDLLARARQIVAEGRLGEVLLVSAVFAQRVYDLYKGDVDAFWSQRPNDARPNTTSYSDPDIVGGGEGHTQASHILGMMLWLTGLSPASVYAQMNALDVAVDVVDAMTITFHGGALANVSANGLLPKGVSAIGIQIQGSQGVLALDLSAQIAYVRLQDHPEMQRIDADLSTHAGHAAGVTAVPRNFVRAVLGREELWVPTRVAIDEVRLLDAAYRSAASGQAVRL